MSEELKPCPFCGSSGITLMEEVAESSEWSVCCWDCDVTGPQFEDAPDAIAHWNTRPESVLVATGKPEVGEFDKGSYSDDHDVPALWIGGQIVALGDGYNNWGAFSEKDENHLIWKLDANKTYRVVIEEDSDGCAWSDPDDKTCSHPRNPTPECHSHICPEEDNDD